MTDTTPSIVLLILCGLLVAVGIYLLLERSLTRIVLGFTALANGINIAFLIAGGKAGEPPLVGQAEVDTMSDPLVQAMVLTAIVIALSTTAFLLAMAYRTWQIEGNDEVQDDVEDTRVAAMALRDERLNEDDHRDMSDADIEATRDEVFDEDGSAEVEPQDGDRK